MTIFEEWIRVKTHFLTLDEVQSQGESLKIRKKMFAMLNKDRFIVKLPKTRVSDLLETNFGLPYDPGNGKIMKEWIIIPMDFVEKWISYASEAKDFALKLANQHLSHNAQKFS